MSTLTNLLDEVEAYTETDARILKEASSKIIELENAITQLIADLEFQNNKIRNLTITSKAFHDFFYKHDPMGYRAFYSQNLGYQHDYHNR